jgi:predicted GNAT superfamily acetyltransferase
VATERKDLLQSAVDVAQRAAERSGVDVRLIGTLAEIHAVHSLFDRIWQPEKNNPPVTVDQLRAMTYAGNYLAGAFDRGSLIGACVGFFAAPPGASMHSHVAGVAAEVRGRNVGFALKLHQRAWALGQGLTEVTWTFDPVVRRNAYFNLAKLGAIPHDYLVDFYGDMDDGINIGQGSDRLLVGWDLGSDAVVDACAGRSVGPDDSLAAAAPFALREVSGEPVVGDDPGPPDVPTIRVEIPADVEKLRHVDPAVARRWRLAVRDVLGGLVAAGAQVTGFSRSGWYAVERAPR